MWAVCSLPIFLVLSSLNLAIAQSYSSLNLLNANQLNIPDASAIAAAANISTGNPAKCGNGTTYFPQPIDHATWDGTYGDNNTFLQQYELIDQFYEPGGPILLMLVDESPELLCLEMLSIPDYAVELGAVAVEFEHRYFGISVPYGLNYSEKSSWDPESLKPLTIENVVADIVVFAKWLRSQYDDAPIILAAGDYAGAVATILRANYPEIFLGAWSSGTITNGLVTDPNAKNMFAWGDWGDFLYGGDSLTAYDKIKKAMEDLRASLANGSYTDVADSLNLCKPPTSQADVDDVITFVVTTYLKNLQYNVPLEQYPFKQVLNQTELLNDSMAILNASVSIWLEWNKETCGDWSTTFGQVDPWLWIRCTFFPTLDVYTHPEGVFGAILPTTNGNMLDPWCNASFGTTAVTGGPEYIKSIGLDDDSLMAMTHLIVAQGLQDPYYAMGPRSWGAGVHSAKEARYLPIVGGAHVADLLKEDPSNSASILGIRAGELATMQMWLAEQTKDEL